MIHTISRLMEGDASIAEYFSKAKTFWTDFYKRHSECTREELAQILSNIQHTDYEMGVFDGKIELARDSMMLTAIATLYKPGEEWDDFDYELAIKMLHAFWLSKCSSEIITSDEVAAIYGLED